MTKYNSVQPYQNIKCTKSAWRPSAKLDGVFMCKVRRGWAEGFRVNAVWYASETWRKICPIFLCEAKACEWQQAGRLEGKLPAYRNNVVRRSKENCLGQVCCLLIWPSTALKLPWGWLRKTGVKGRVIRVCKAWGWEISTNSKDNASVGVCLSTTGEVYEWMKTAKGGRVWWTECTATAWNVVECWRKALSNEYSDWNQYIIEYDVRHQSNK